MSKQYEVTTFYLCDGLSFPLDEEAMNAVGRDTDSSGWGCGERDLSWSCKSRAEAHAAWQALKDIGMDAIIIRM